MPNGDPLTGSAVFLASSSHTVSANEKTPAALVWPESLQSLGAMDRGVPAYCISVRSRVASQLPPKSCRLNRQVLGLQVPADDTARTNEREAN
jgi:hypothetical protein